METTIYSRETTLPPPKAYGFSQILSIAQRYYQRNFTAVFITSVLILLPLNILLTKLNAPQFSAKGTGLMYTNLLMTLAFAFGIVILQSIVNSIGSLALAYIVKRDADNQPVSVSTALTEAFHCLPNAIAVALLQAGVIFVIIALGAIIAIATKQIWLVVPLFIPIVALSVYWQFAIFAVLLARTSGISALRYSKQLVEKRWSKVFFFTLGYGIVQALFGAVLGLFFGLVLEPILPATLYDLLSNAVNSLVNALFLIVSVVFFLNLQATRFGVPVSTETTTAPTNTAQ